MEKFTEQDFAEERQAVEEWQAKQAESRTSIIQRQARAIMESAAEEPIAMAIFARRIIHNETYEDAISKVMAVTSQKISNAAIRQRVCRMKKMLYGS